jgi:hypothetical protein
MVKVIAELRNERIEATKKISEVRDIFYHCIVRSAGAIYTFEEPMHTIDIENIKLNVDKKNNNIAFTDGKENYSFYPSKSTLYKYFVTKDKLFEIPVRIIEDPFEAISKLLTSEITALTFSPIQEGEHIFLPIYSTRDGEVPEKSGLNLWNAGGRKRDPNEVYIPVPRFIHRNFPNFFPARDKTFNLSLPTGEVISASICQDGDKALMSNPNTALGSWILRDILKAKEGQLITYADLEKIGFDSFVVYKTNDQNYSIDFTALGSYDDFEQSLENEEVEDSSDTSEIV